MSPMQRILALFAPERSVGDDMSYWLVTGIVLVTSLLALFYGRRFFWILAGLLGFLVGQIASQYVVIPVPVIATFLQLALGVVLGLLAAALQWPIAFALAFGIGGTLGGQIVYMLQGATWMVWTAFVAGGALVMLMLQRRYAETLIALSALVGAGRIALGLHNLVPSMTERAMWMLGAALLVAGITFQSLELRRERRQPYQIPVSAGGALQDEAP